MSGRVLAAVIEAGFMVSGPGRKGRRPDPASRRSARAGTMYACSRNKVTLPAKDRPGGSARVNTTPHGHHMALPPVAVQLRHGWAAGCCTGPGVCEL